MIDKQGRINLTQELCELFNYTGGMKVWFVWEEESVFRLVPEADVVGDDKLIASARLDEKRRLFVPKSVREHYTNEAIVYGKKEDSYIYISFLERSNATAGLISKLIKKLEDLITLLSSQQD